MAQPPSMELRTRQTQSLKQLQRMIMSPQMQQAITVLQMPILELSNRLETEIAENPLLEDETESNGQEEEDLQDESDENRDVAPERELEFDDHQFEILKRIDEDFREYINENNVQTKRTSEEEKLKTFIDSSLSSHTTLFEYLMRQAHETFSSEDELAMAEAIVGNLNSSGFLDESLEDIADFNNFTLSKLSLVLKQIQKFDPPGVGAINLHESLLIQLKHQGKKNSLAYRIINECYQDLIYNRLNNMQKTLNCSCEEISKAIEGVIAKLEFHPGANFSSTHSFPIVPDVTIFQEGEEFKTSVNEEPLPQFRFNRHYLNMLEDPSIPLDTRDFIKQKILSARWFLQTIHQRNSTLERIATSLARRQKKFFSQPDGQLVPLTMKMLAEELEVHESTIARAVANKYLNSPRGLFPLRFFFSNAYLTKEGVDLSSETVREKLAALIKKENKSKPLSDEALSLLLQSQGITCARRTIAKYRAAMNLGNARQRKKYSGKLPK